MPRLHNPKLSVCDSIIPFGFSIESAPSKSRPCDCMQGRRHCSSRVGAAKFGKINSNPLLAIKRSNDCSGAEPFFALNSIWTGAGWPEMKVAMAFSHERAAHGGFNVLLFIYILALSCCCCASSANKNRRKKPSNAKSFFYYSPNTRKWDWMMDWLGT